MGHVEPAEAPSWTPRRPSPPRPPAPWTLHVAGALIGVVTVPTLLLGLLFLLPNVEVEGDSGPLSFLAIWALMTAWCLIALVADYRLYTRPTRGWWLVLVLWSLSLPVFALAELVGDDPSRPIPALIRVVTSLAPFVLLVLPATRRYVREAQAMRASA